jgi:heme O synthase-like polyprenyltransferase
LVAFAWRLWKNGGNRLANGLCRYSSMYLALIFVALVVDALLRA